MLPGVKPLTHLGLNQQQLVEHCQHIVEERDRYMPERVFEAKEILNQHNNAHEAEQSPLSNSDVN